MHIPFRRTLLLPSLAALVAVPAIVGASTTAAAAPPVTPQLVAVRAASHAGYDRVVWEFRGGLPATRTISRVAELTADGSGEPIRIAGSTILQLTMFQANGHDEESPYTDTSPARLVPGLTNVVDIAQSGDFEATVSYGIGLVKNTPYRLWTLPNPSRVILDVRTDFAKANRSVYFLDVADFNEGHEPYTERVTRRVPAFTPAGAVLHHLFAGPTTAEESFGLATVRSGATGFRNLSISSTGIARVTLTGGCDSGGSTFTVANLIMPTLKQFSNVRYVKIYDPSGHTEFPTGNSSSIPECLEP